LRNVPKPSDKDPFFFNELPPFRIWFPITPRKSTAQNWHKTAQKIAAENVAQQRVVAGKTSLKKMRRLHAI
jgi:hypothetical protein